MTDPRVKKLASEIYGDQVPDISGADAEAAARALIERIEHAGLVVSLPENVDLRAIIADDAREWPYGHPCRDCGALLKDHPTPSRIPGVAACEEWR